MRRLLLVVCTAGLLAGQDVFTVPTMRTKLDAQLRGIGVGLCEPSGAKFGAAAYTIAGAGSSASSRVVCSFSTWMASVRACWSPAPQTTPPS